MEILVEISKAIEILEEEKAVGLVEEALKQKVDPTKILEEGIIPGIRAVGNKFEKEEYYLADVIVGADITERCISLVEPRLPKKEGEEARKVVIGTVQGDIHGIGKGLVALMLKINGFEVYDLGVDVPIMTFIDKAEELKADVIALSALMFTTMPVQSDVIRYLKDLGSRDKYKVVIGGAPTSEAYAEEIGSDGWSRDASEAVKMIQSLLMKK